MEEVKRRKGFSALTPERRREIASMGGKAVKPENRQYSKNPELAKQSGKKGGKLSSGNFKNNPERAAEAGKKGGSAKNCG